MLEHQHGFQAEIWCLPTSFCVLSPVLFNLPEPCDSWLPRDGVFYYLLHVSKAMRHLSLSVWLFHLIQCPMGSSLLSWMLSSLSFWDHSCEYVNASWNSVSLVICCCSVTPMTQALWQVLYGSGTELVILLDELISVLFCIYPVLGFLDHILLLFLVFGITALLFFFE